MRKKLGEIAVAKRWVTAQELAEILESQQQLRVAGKSSEEVLLGRLLIAEGLLSEAMLQTLLGEQMGWPARVLFDAMVSGGPAFQFGAYQIERFIATGGMGNIYEALEQKTGRHLALKIIHTTLFTPNARDRFLREMQILSRLHHPGIVAIHDCGHLDGLDFFVMDFLAGQNLQTALGQCRFSYREWLAKFVKMLEGVARMHEEKIIHRDLKPSNIMLTADQELVILDFGISKIMEETCCATPLTSHPLGTLAYMAPEQTLCGVLHDRRTDIWALGVILYQLLTGHLPWEGNNDTALIQAIRHDPPTSIMTYAANLPPELNAICMRAMEKAKEQRYQSVAAMAGDIQAILEGRPPAAASAPPHRKHESNWFISKSWGQKVSLAANIGLLATTLMLGIFYLLYMALSFTSLENIARALQVHTPDITRFAIRYKFVLMGLSILLMGLSAGVFFKAGRYSWVSSLFSGATSLIFVLLIYICHWAISTPLLDMFRPQWMTILQASQYLQMSEEKVGQLAKSGELPGLQIGEEWRFEKNEIDLWLRKQARQEAQEKSLPPK